MIKLYIMYIVLDLKSFNNKHVYYGEKQTNNILNYCSYTSLYYSTPLYTTNNILFEIPMKFMNIKMNNNVLYCYFDLSKDGNKRFIHTLSTIEHKILTKNNLFQNKSPKYILANQLKKGYVKINISSQHTPQMNLNLNNTQFTVLFRISGVWENINNESGIIFKFILKSKNENMLNHPDNSSSLLTSSISSCSLSELCYDTDNSLHNNSNPSTPTHVNFEYDTELHHPSVKNSKLSVL